MLNSRFNRLANSAPAMHWPCTAIALCLSLLIAGEVSAAEKQVYLGAGDARILPYSFTPVFYLPADGKSQLTKDYPVLQAIFGNKFGEAAEGRFVMPKLTGLNSPKGRPRVSVETRRDEAKSLVKTFRATALKVSDHVTKLEQALEEFSRINAGKPENETEKGAKETKETKETGQSAEQPTEIAKAVSDAELLQQSFAAIATVKSLDAAIGIENSDAVSQEEKRIEQIVVLSMKHSLALKKSLENLAARTEAVLKTPSAELNLEQAEQLKKARANVVCLQAGFKTCDESLAALSTQYQDSVFTPKFVQIPMAIAINGVNQEPLIGEIRLFACNYSPRDWVRCDGRELPVSRHKALSMLLMDQFGGDGEKTFALPKMAGPIANSKTHLQYHIAMQGMYPRTGNGGVGQDKAGSGYGNSMLSEVRLMPYETAPRGWLPCDGRTMPIAKNKSLYALLGKAFGGDGKKTFKLPNLKPVKTGAGELRYYIVVQGAWPSRN